MKIVVQVSSELNSILAAPDETVHQNLRNVEPGSYLLPFKRANGDQEFLRMANSAKSTGPVHTYIKTDKNANFKWGVRHFVGKKYSR